MIMPCGTASYQKVVVSSKVRFDHQQWRSPFQSCYLYFSQISWLGLDIPFF